MLAIESANQDSGGAAAFAELKSMATGGALVRTLGIDHKRILAQLYAADDTLESFSRNHTASIDGNIVGHISCIPAREYRKRWAGTLKRIRAISLVAGLRIQLDDARRSLSGTALGPWEHDQMYIESVAVFEPMRRQGIASLLFESAIRLTRAYGCSTLSLNTLETNTSAVAFYASLGFEVHRRRGRHLRLIKDAE